MRKTASDAPQMDASSFTSSFTTCNFARDLRADAESGSLHVAKTSLEGSEASCLTISKPMPREQLGSVSNSRILQVQQEGPVISQVVVLLVIVVIGSRSKMVCNSLH